MPVPPPDPEHDITRYQDVPDDDRLDPLALVKALKLRDQCLTLFKGHLAWNTDYLRACFLSGTLVDVNTQLFESWSGTYYNEPIEDVYVLELYKWIQGMIREHRIIHVRLPPVLPWGMVKTAISFVLVVAKQMEVSSPMYDTIVHALKSVVEWMPPIVEHTAAIIVNNSVGPDHRNFGDLVQLVFFKLCKLLSSIVSCLGRSAIRNDIPAYKRRKSKSTNNIEEKRISMIRRLVDFRHGKRNVNFKKVFCGDEHLEPNYRSSVSLFIVDSKPRLRSLRKEQIEGTCTWTVSHPLISDWTGVTYEGPTRQRLWLHGESGVGKSFAAAHLISEYKDTYSLDELDATILYFFCHPDHCSIRNILCSFIDQLCVSNLKYIYVHTQTKLVGRLLRAEHYKIKHIGVPELTNIIISLLRSYTQARIVIDALDICAHEDVELLMETLQNILKHPRLSSRVKVLLLSQRTEFLTRQLHDWDQVEIGGPTTRPDLQKYVTIQASRVAGAISALGHDESQLRQALLDASKANFVYARILADEVIAQKDISPLIRERSQGLDGLYDSILWDYMKSSTDEEKEARCRILQSLSYCKDPIPLQALEIMLREYIGCHVRPRDVQLYLEKLLGLVVKFRVGEDDIVRVSLVHGSFADYLRRLRDPRGTFPATLLPLKELMRRGDFEVPFKCEGLEISCEEEHLLCLHNFDHSASSPIPESQEPVARYSKGDESIIDNPPPSDGTLLYWMFTALREYKNPELVEARPQYFVDAISVLRRHGGENEDRVLRLVWAMRSTPGFPEHIESHEDPQHYFQHYLSKALHRRTWSKNGPYVLTYLYGLANSDYTPISAIRSRLQTMRLDILHKHEVISQCIQVTGVTLEANVSPLGKGGFSKVYKGFHNGEAVAIKKLKRNDVKTRHPGHDIVSFRALYHEGLIWWDLKHDHIVKLIGITQELFENTPCLVMELMEKGTIVNVMNARIRSFRDSPHEEYGELQRQVHIWLEQTSSGLSYVHGEDVIHGDLTGNNILIDNSGNVRITDFGIAVVGRKFDPTSYSMRGGPLRFLAPELQRNNDDETKPTCRPRKSSDVYSFACVCLQLYTLRVPDLALIKSAQNRHQPVPPTFQDQDDLDIPDDLWKLMTDCWSVTPNARPETKKLLITLSAMNKRLESHSRRMSPGRGRGNARKIRSQHMSKLPW